MPAVITTTTRTMKNRFAATMTEDSASLARLLWFASPAFPTGGFAYSNGLEWAVETRDVTGAQTLLAWISALLHAGSGRSDAIFVRHAFRAANTPVILQNIADLAAAAAPSRERQMEALGQGEAFAAAARAWDTNPHPAAYPVAFGSTAARQGIGEEQAIIGYLTAWCGNLVSAGIRLIPLGQSAGLSVLADLEPHLLHTAATTRTATLDDIGTACFRADIASMRHETQYSRMFRS